MHIILLGMFVPSNRGPWPQLHVLIHACLNKPLLLVCELYYARMQGWKVTTDILASEPGEAMN